MPRPGKAPTTWLSWAIVRGTNPQNRHIDIDFMGSDRGKKSVPVVTDFNSYSFPKKGDTVLVAVQGEEVFCIGKGDFNYKEKLGICSACDGTGTVNDEECERCGGDGKVVAKDKAEKSKTIKATDVKDGEINLKHLTELIQLYFSNTGNFYLKNGLKDGLSYLARQKILELAGSLVKNLGNGVTTAVGSVLRNIPTEGMTPIPGDTEPTAKEFFTDILVSGIRIVRFHLGHIFPTGNNPTETNVTTPEQGSWGARLRALLEICNPASGTPLAVLKMDESGNIELSSVSGILMVDGNPTNGILLGGLSAAQSAVLGEAWHTWAASHTHSTGTGPSGVPITLPDSNTILSKKVKISS